MGRERFANAGWAGIRAIVEALGYAPDAAGSYPGLSDEDSDLMADIIGGLIVSSVVGLGVPPDAMGAAVGKALAHLHAAGHFGDDGSKVVLVDVVPFRGTVS